MLENFLTDLYNLILQKYPKVQGIRVTAELCGGREGGWWRGLRSSVYSIHWNKSLK